MSILEEAGQEAQQAADGQETARNVEGRTQWQLTWLRLRNGQVAMIALAVVILMIVIAIAAPAFAALTHHAVDAAYPDTGEDDSGNPVGPGVNGFWLGTDSTGRYLLVRIVYGARISLFVGIVTTLIAVVLGVGIGLIAGYFGGVIGTILARPTRRRAGVPVRAAGAGAGDRVRAEPDAHRGPDHVLLLGWHRAYRPRPDLVLEGERVHRGGEIAGRGPVQDHVPRHPAEPAGPGARRRHPLHPERRRL